MRAVSQIAPPKIKMAAPSSLKFFAGVVLGMAVLGASAVVYFFNPSTHGFYPVCLFHQLTGLNCPGCGATRALYALLHGNIMLALKDNALFIFASVALLSWSARFIFRKRQNQNVTLNMPQGFLWVFLIIAIVFTVLRNLPTFPFLSP